MANTIHGDKNQRDRDQAISSFKSGNSRILIATDVAARGLDIKDVNYVINYDFPPTLESYIHRIGRTGRAGKKGISLSYMTDVDAKHAKKLIQTVTHVGQDVPRELVLLDQMHTQSKTRR